MLSHSERAPSWQWAAAIIPFLLLKTESSGTLCGPEVFLLEALRLAMGASWLSASSTSSFRMTVTYGGGFTGFCATMEGSSQTERPSVDAISKRWHMATAPLLR